MKVNLDLNVNIKSGAALIIYTIGFFALTLMAKNAAINSIYGQALIAWTGAVSFFWIKRANNNKLRIESDKIRAMVSSGAENGDKGDPLT